MLSLHRLSRVLHEGTSCFNAPLHHSVRSLSSTRHRYAARARRSVEPVFVIGDEDDELHLGKSSSFGSLPEAVKDRLKTNDEVKPPVSAEKTRSNRKKKTTKEDDTPSAVLAREHAVDRREDSLGSCSKAEKKGRRSKAKDGHIIIEPTPESVQLFDTDDLSPAERLIEEQLERALNDWLIPDSPLAHSVFRNWKRFPDCIVLTKVGKFYEVSLTNTSVPERFSLFMRTGSLLCCAQIDQYHRHQARHAYTKGSRTKGAKNHLVTVPVRRLSIHSSRQVSQNTSQRSRAHGRAGRGVWG